MTAAISVEHVTKKYRLYHERNQSVKAAIMRGRRARYDEFLALDDVSFEIREGIATVKHQNMAGSDIGDNHKEYFAGEAALKAGGVHNTMNQFS